MAYLEVLNGPEVGKQVGISQDTFFIGREASNHLVLSDRTVSRKHAVINQVEGQFVVSDLKSLKGILVNGVKATEVALQDGDELAVGAVRLSFYLTQRKNAAPIIGEKKNRTVWWVGGALLVVLSVAGGFYFAPQRAATPLEEHYQRGVQLYNEQHNVDGARQEWDKVLAQDPRKETVFGQKAAKLLKNIEQK